MGRSYSQFLSTLGYQILERLRPSSCNVYKVQRGNAVQVAKIGDLSYRGFPYQHVRREHEVLQKLTGVEGIPQELFFNSYEGRKKFALLLKEYIPGRTLQDDPQKLSLSQKDSLEVVVAALHDKGIANMDMEYLGKNVVITPNGKPYLIDFGDAYFRSEKSEEEFSSFKEGDLRGLRSIFQRFG